MVRSVDIGEVNGRAFINNSGLGLYASLVTQREKRRHLGQPKWIAFFWAAVATVRRFPFLYVRLAAGGQQLAIRTPFLFVGNNAYRMEGINLGSRDSLTEGKLCVGVTHHRIGRWGLVRLAFHPIRRYSTNGTSLSSLRRFESIWRANLFRSMARWCYRIAVHYRTRRCGARDCPRRGMSRTLVSFHIAGTVDRARSIDQRRATDAAGCSRGIGRLTRARASEFLGRASIDYRSRVSWCRATMMFRCITFMDASSSGWISTNAHHNH
jgi:hypothetical protein